MSRGPLPTGTAARRNQPTIPTTELPVAGNTGKAPRCPYELGPAGKAWWRWAWKTPQAAAWHPVADVYVVARRATLEDERAALEETPDNLVADLLPEVLLAGEERDALLEISRSLDWLLSALQRRAGGVRGIYGEMRELDKRLGLDPKAVLELRWKFTGAAPAAKKPAARRPASAGRSAAALKVLAVDPDAAAE